MIRNSASVELRRFELNVLYKLLSREFNRKWDKNIIL